MKPTPHSDFRLPTLRLRLIALILAFFVPLGTAPVTLRAATLTWDADTGTSGAQDGGGNWTVAGTTFWNGSTNVITTNNTSTDIAQFGNGGTLASQATINVDTRSINGLIFGTTTTSGYNLTASSAGQILTLGDGGITVNSGAQATNVGSANLGITLGGNQVWKNASSSLLSVNGNVINGGFTITVGAVSNTGNVSIGGDISGSGGLSFNLPTRVVLSGASTFTGQVSVFNNGTGTLAFTSIADFGTASALGAGTAGTAIQMGSGSSGSVSLEYIGSGNSESNRTVQIGSSVAGATRGGTIRNNGSGTLTFDATNFNPTIAGITATRALGLAGTNTGNNTISGIIQDNNTAGGGVVNLIKSDVGTWILSGSNTNTGTTAISGGGTLVLDYTSTGSKLSDTAALTLGSAGGGTITLKGGAHTEVVLSTSLSTGGTFITRDGGTSKLQMNAISRIQGGNISFLDGTVATTDNTNTNNILGGWATIGDNWAINSTNLGDGAITALGSYTGALPSGTGAATANYTLSGSQSGQSSTVLANTVKITGTGITDNTLDLAGTRITISGGAALNTSGGILYIGGGTGIYNITSTSTGGIGVGTNNRDLIINTVRDTLNISARIGAVQASAGLVKAGAGTLVLSSPDSAFTQAVYVNEGVLRLAHANAAGTIAGGIVVQNNAALELASSVAIGAEALTITGNGSGSNTGALRNVASNTSSYAGAITIALGGARINSDASGSLTLTGGIDTAGRNVTFGGAGNTTVSTAAITGAGGLIKDGAGTTTLSATNDYTGATTVSAGRLTIASTGLINTTSGLTINGATANFRYNSSTNYSAPLTFTQGTLSGTNWGGSLSGLTIGTNQTISPGNSPGTATSVTQTWAGGGTYQWEINDTTGTIGLDPGWDWLNLSGALTQTSTSGNKFTIDITGLTTGNVAGAVSNWNPASSSTYIIASAAGGITGFDATGYTLNLANFTNNNTSSGTWSIFQGNGGNGGTVNDILLGYVASGGIPTAYWAGTTSGDWGNVNNWRDAATGGAVIGSAPSSSTDVHFSTVTTPVPGNLGAVNLGANFTVKTLAFDAASTAVTIGSSGGFTLTITPTSSANGINVDTTAGDNILSVKVELGAAQTWTVNANRTLTANGVVSGAFGLTKAGLGDLVLGASNTYTGVTQINQGKLKINDLTNLGAGGVGNSVGIDGGTLQSTSNTYALGGNRSILLGAGGGTIDTVSGGVTVDGIVSGTGALTKSGAGVLTLSATNTYTGNTNLNAGTINLGAAENAGVSGPLGNQAANAAGTIVMGGGTLQYSASNTFDYSGRFSTAGSQAWNIDTNGQNVAFATALVGASSTLTKLGTGILSLNGTNANTYNGTTTVTGGTLDLNKTAGVNAIAGNLTINGGTVRLQANEQIADTATITQTSGTFNLNGKTETIVSYNKTGGTFTTGRGGSLIGTGTSITYDGAGSNQIEVDSSVVDGHVTLTNGATLDLAGATDPFDMGPDGTNGGILQISSGGTGLEMNGTAGNTINLASDTNSTTAARIVLDDDVTTGGTGLNTIASTGVGATKGYVALGASGSRTFTVGDSVSGTGTDLDISAVISSTGAGLTKAGAGTLATSAVNTYTGATSVNAGIFQVGVAGVGSTHADSDVTATSATFTTAATGAGVNASNVAVTGQTVITVGPVVAGSGTIFGDLTVGTNSSNVGVIRPGDVSGSSNGTLTIGGNLVVNNGSQIQMGLASTTQNDAAFNWYVPTGGQNALTYLTSVVTAGDYTSFWDSADGGYDSINVTGTLSLGTGGTDYPTHIVSVNPSYTPVLGDIFKLLDWSGIGFHDPDAIGGTHSLPSDLVLPTLAAGFTWDTSAYNGFGVVVVIPEPGRMMLLFFGLAALFLRRRRNR